MPEGGRRGCQVEDECQGGEMKDQHGVRMKVMAKEEVRVPEGK